LVYFLFRLCIFAVWGEVVRESWDLWVADVHHPPMWMWWIYMTHQCAFIELIYFFFAMVSTGMAAFGRQVVQPGDSMPWFVRITLVLADAVPCLAIMTSLMFWAPSLAGTSDLMVDEMSMKLHVLNLVLALLDAIFSRLPRKYSHAWVPLVYSMGYIIFSYVYYLSGGTDYKGNHYIYNVLDWGGLGGAPPLVAFVEALALIITPFAYCFVIFLIRCFGRGSKTWMEENGAVVPAARPGVPQRRPGAFGAPRGTATPPPWS
jgi:hypothetical protein